MRAILEQTAKRREERAVNRREEVREGAGEGEREEGSWMA